MRLVRGHKDRLPGAGVDRLAGDSDVGFAFQDVDQRVERRGVLTRAWPVSKAKSVTVPFSCFTSVRLTTAPSW